MVRRLRLGLLYSEAPREGGGFAVVVGLCDIVDVARGDGRPKVLSVAHAGESLHPLPSWARKADAVRLASGQ